MTEEQIAVLKSQLTYERQRADKAEVRIVQMELEFLKRDGQIYDLTQQLDGIEDFRRWFMDYPSCPEDENCNQLIAMATVRQLFEATKNAANKAANKDREKLIQNDGADLLIEIAARYVDLGNQIVTQTPDLPGIAQSCDQAYRLCCHLIGKEMFDARIQAVAVTKEKP